MATILKSFVLKPGERFTLPPDANLISYTGVVSSSCGELPDPETQGCYGINVIIADGETGSSAATGDQLNVTGVVLGGTSYDLTVAQMNAGFEDLQAINVGISLNSQLSGLITGFRSARYSSTDQGGAYIVVFSSFASLMTNAYFKARLSARVGDQDGPNDGMNVFIPIYPLSELQTITGVTTFTCD